LCYLFLLLPHIAVGHWMATAAVLSAVVFMSRQARLSARGALALLAAGYVLQDLSHWLTSEATYQASYSDGGQFTEHCFFLVPLCADLVLPEQYDSPLRFMETKFPLWVAVLSDWCWLLVPLVFLTVGNYNLDSKNTFCFFPGCPYFGRVVTTNIADENTGHSQKSNLSLIRRWAMSRKPPPNTSTHFWFRDLPPPEKAAFHAAANCYQICNMFRSLFNEKHYCMEVVEGMNEVYVTGPSRSEENLNSDQIFYTKHVDGPYGFMPFVSVYRCIVGMDRNYMTTTRFPMNPGVDIHACEGDVVGFDFNREVHYITRDESRAAESDEYRVTLKLHYVMYPRVLAPLGKLMLFLNVRYNIAFRALFLKTLNPKSTYERFLAWNVVVNTSVYNSLEMYIGTRNLLYLASVFSMAWMTGEYRVFLFMTSYVHYIRYIGTYYFRDGVDFGSFKRDVLLFKNISLCQMYYLLIDSIRTSGGVEVFDVSTFFQSCTRNISPVALLMIILGYFVSIKATVALGLDRTYFGSELGQCEPKWVSEFPYGYVPHPMIVGQVIALLGIRRVNCFSEAWPALVPVHILLYLVHLLQEHFNVH
ncbi:unnamed protein product, partial [Ectocarpus fasciculatus]